MIKKMPCKWCTQDYSDDAMCHMHINPGYGCTRPRGHRGPHIACYPQEVNLSRHNVTNVKYCECYYVDILED